MATQMADESGTSSSLLFVVVRHILQSIVYTPVYMIAVGFIVMPFTLIVISSPETKPGAYVLLSLGGLALYMGQIESLGEVNRDETDYHWFEKIVITVTSVVYYNVIFFLTLVFALATYQTGYPGIAVLIGFLLPAIDLHAGREYGVGVVVLFVILSSKIGKKGAQYFDRLTKHIKSIGKILVSVNDIFPPVFAHLELTVMARRRFE